MPQLCLSTVVDTNTEMENPLTSEHSLKERLLPKSQTVLYCNLPIGMQHGALYNTEHCGAL